MSGQDAPYDPYIPSGQGGAPQQQQGGNTRTQALQAVSCFHCWSFVFWQLKGLFVPGCLDADDVASCRSERERPKHDNATNERQLMAHTHSRYCAELRCNAFDDATRETRAQKKLHDPPGEECDSIPVAYTHYLTYSHLACSNTTTPMASDNGCY